MASSSKPKRIYDVFLSFRGTDLRKNFVGHLYTALNQNGVHTFIDSEELRKGDQISVALMKAIEESCIAIIVFSEDYASSWWCLEEAAKIMECKEQGDLIVFSVFYKVEPKEVRTPRESYNKAMDKHEFKFGKDLEKVKRWKKALFDAGGLSGWHLNEGDESKLIQEIVKEISTYLVQTSLHVAKHPVGIDSPVAELKLMLNLKSHEDVVMVGLWGQGGIGKTTLSKALYNAIFRQFDGSCFLANVREASKNSKDLVPLQERLLFDILKLQKKLEVSSVDRGIILIQQRLCHEKVLLVLDDVDDLHQLEALAGGRNWFGDGSRIIVTTRDKHLLTCHEIDQDHVYEVKALYINEARELFSNHAFSTCQKIEIATDLVDKVLNHVGGLPLAIVVLGSFLLGRRECEWESTLNNLSRIPDETINNVLKISYDGLDANAKEIFLDIACFFKWRNIEYVKKVIDSCGYEATIGLEILIERSLISISFRGGLEVHDLIQSMGMDIVRQECRSDLGRRSRLWLYDDVVDVLSHDMGDCVVEAIVLQPLEPIEIYISRDAFTKMRKLRLLILDNVHNSFQGPIFLPKELRWFRWDGCAFYNLKFSHGPKKLVGLELSNCSITAMPNQLKGFQQLKYMTLRGCNSLVSMPDLSCTPNLEELYLFHCKKLLEIHESVAYHYKLRVLHLLGCNKFSIFPSVLQSKNLQRLFIEECKKFGRFPDIPHKLESLKELHIKESAIKEIPASIENLCSLKSMRLSSCENLA
ncbi:hypothetical protein EUGRSUZ_E02543, partial [Eucalyptus grandis]